ncbi:acetyl-CoA carboxylase biotin carboxyl carrier protein [Salipiger abyssi]|uniref:acetyl-CoA carboxylase biotin carboxyl carrier protein n=1 Tax=Salipiger abyssi TaxID=1250539 RepID=UPI001A8F9D2C|nr:biotin/lipoyl-containing protein [Salipiger abyssi]MBN9887175.1 acetyl-CoA carboxylase, biotin carboxyl carrier protein [Salipiger abyssi]
MSLSNDDIRQILSLVEASSFNSIELQIGDLKLSARKSAPSAHSIAPAAPPPAAAPGAPPPPAPSTAPVAAEHEDGLSAIEAPIVGTFYLAPEPGAAPFVTEGDAVTEETTIGVIEVMKVFTHVKADRPGTVVRCLAGDGDFVEFGQPLVLIRPEA